VSEREKQKERERERDLIQERAQAHVQEKKSFCAGDSAVCAHVCICFVYILCVGGWVGLGRWVGRRVCMRVCLWCTCMCILVRMHVCGREFVLACWCERAFVCVRERDSARGKICVSVHGGPPLHSVTFPFRNISITFMHVCKSVRQRVREV